MPIKKNYLVEKRNVLNEMHAIDWTFPEARLFTIYLARINARDITTRKVRFPLSEFRIIMELDPYSGSTSITYLESVTKGLLQKVVTLSNDSTIYYDANGNEISPYSQFQLFKECEVGHLPNGEWFIELDAHDKALPLMFEFKNKYFTYPVANVLRLASFNQIRMYEILAQHACKGELIIAVDELRKRLGISEKEYPAYKDFRVYVLEACQSALLRSTDLAYTFEPYGKRGKGGKIFELKFTITRNTQFVNQIYIDGWEGLFYSSYISDDPSDPLPSFTVFPAEPARQYDEYLEGLADVTKYEFSNAEMQLLHSLIVSTGPHADQYGEATGQMKYLQMKYAQMNANNERKKIRYRFKYLCRLIELDNDE